MTSNKNQFKLLVYLTVCCCFISCGGPAISKGKIAYQKIVNHINWANSNESNNIFISGSGCKIGNVYGFAKFKFYEKEPIGLSGELDTSLLVDYSVEVLGNKRSATEIGDFGSFSLRPYDWCKKDCHNYYDFFISAEWINRDSSTGNKWLRVLFTKDNKIEFVLLQEDGNSNWYQIYKLDKNEMDYILNIIKENWYASIHGELDLSRIAGDHERDRTAEIVKTEAKRKIENMEDANVCSTVLRKIMNYDERYYFEGINDKASSQLINLDDYDVILNIPEELGELDELESTVEKNMDGINKIHPIGWSKNGLFAYIETGNSDMVGGFNRLKVTDMVSDKNIVSYTGGDEMVSLSTKEWWCLNYIEISSLLNQYEISDKGMVLEMNNEDVVIKYLSYKDISDADNNSIYSITTKYSNCRKSNNIAVCDGQTCDAQVIVTNNNTGKEKSIFKKNSFCGSKLTFVTAIKNPLEDRITILVEYEKLGFEGVYTRDIINIGCRLF